MKGGNTVKIISNFKDYYDYIPHMSGGGDPKIVFVRPRVNHDLPSRVDLGSFGGDIFDKICRLSNYLYRDYQSKIVIIGDKIFYFTMYNPIDKPELKEGNYSIITQKVIDKCGLGWYRTTKFNLDYFINHQDNDLIPLCKHIGHPVFSLFSSGRGSEWEVGEIAPNLGKLGIASYIDAEIMYQNLSYFVGNLMHDSPDTSPPVELSNRDRILKHGFDLKTSFRGKAI